MWEGDSLYLCQNWKSWSVHKFMKNLHHLDSENSRLHEGKHISERPLCQRVSRRQAQYLGNILRGNSYPKLLDDMFELFDGRYSEVLLMDAIGCTLFQGKVSVRSEHHDRTAIPSRRRRPREAKEKMRREEHRYHRPLPPVVPNPEAVLMKVNQMVADKELLDFIPKSAHEVFKHVLGEEKRIKAIHLLTYEAIKQVGRIERMTELEAKMPFMLPNGANEIAKMTDISAQLLRYELGVEMLRGKYGMLPQAGATDSDLSPMAKELLQFDEVDRSLLREITVRTIELAKGEIDGRFEAVGLEDDGTGAKTEAAEDSSRTLETNNPPRS